MWRSQSMMMYENVTYEMIRDRMLSRIPDKFDKREGSVIWDTHSPTAIELRILYIELDAILREAYGDTASRKFLIFRCKEQGITPYPATNAVLKGVSPRKKSRMGNTECGAKWRGVLVTSFSGP